MYYQASLEYQCINYLSEEHLEELRTRYELPPNERTELVKALFFTAPSSFASLIQSYRKTLASIPVELYTEIIGYLPLKQRYQLMTVNRRLWELPLNQQLRELKSITATTFIKYLEDRPRNIIIHRSLIDLFKYRLNDQDYLYLYKLVWPFPESIRALYVDFIISKVKDWCLILTFLCQLETNVTEYFMSRLEKLKHDEPGNKIIDLTDFEKIQAPNKVIIKKMFEEWAIRQGYRLRGVRLSRRARSAIYINTYNPRYHVPCGINMRMYSTLTVGHPYSTQAQLQHYLDVSDPIKESYLRARVAKFIIN